MKLTIELEEDQLRLMVALAANTKAIDYAGTTYSMTGPGLKLLLGLQWYLTQKLQEFEESGNDSVH